MGTFAVYVLHLSCLVLNGALSFWLLKMQRKILGAYLHITEYQIKCYKLMFSTFLISLHWLDRVLWFFGGCRARDLLCKAVFSTDLSLCITDASTFPFIPLSKICHLQLIDIQYSGLFQSCMQSSLLFLVWSVITTALHLILGLNLAAWKLELIKREMCWDELPCQELLSIKV